MTGYFPKGPGCGSQQEQDFSLLHSVQTDSDLQTIGTQKGFSVLIKNHFLSRAEVNKGEALPPLLHTP
jgi:predicted ribosome quality control (RQC) complex YloA/Tae2 family protein